MLLGVVFPVLLPFGAARADMIALESYAGSRPRDAGDLLEPLLSEMESRGFISGAPLVESANERISQPATFLSGAELAEARRLIEAGIAQYREGQFEEAASTIERGKRILDGAPATLAREQGQRDVLFDALVYLAQSNSRQGRGVEATRAMAELIRSFPDKEISNARHGPEPRKLYRKVKKDLEAQGLGSLEIEIDDDKTVVFLDERYVGVGGSTVNKLYPGRYRVFVQQGEKPGRVHEVDVDAGATAKLAISWGIDSALQTGDQYAALVYDSEEARSEHEAVHAIRIARALNATGVAIVGIRDYKGRRSIVGTLLSLDSTKPVRTAALAVEPVEPSAEKLRAMGRFLAGDEAAAKLFANLAGAAEEETPKSGSHDVGAGRPFRTWKWIGVVGGLATVGTGVALIAMDKPAVTDGERQGDARETRTAGIVTTAVGGVLTLAGVYFWIRDGKDAKKSRMALVPTAGGATFVFSGRF